MKWDHDGLHHMGYSEKPGGGCLVPGSPHCSFALLVWVERQAPVPRSRGPTASWSREAQRQGAPASSRVSPLNHTVSWHRLEGRLLQAHHPDPGTLAPRTPDGHGPAATLAHGFGVDYFIVMLEKCSCWPQPPPRAAIVGAHSPFPFHMGHTWWETEDEA